jgi:hypothetical protein
MALLSDLQAAAAAQLSAQDFFTDAGNGEAARPIAVWTELIGDLATRVQTQVGKLGIVCVVLTPRATMSEKNRTRPYFNPITLVVRTYENVMLNRGPSGTQQPAALVAEAAAWYLHGFRPSGLQAGLFLEAIELAEDPRLLVYETALSLQAGLTNDAPARVALA